MVTRRQLLWAGGIGGAAAALLPGGRSWAGEKRWATALPRLDPGTLPKYVAPLRILPALPHSRVDPFGENGPVDEYTIGLRQFRQQILPPGRPTTTVWGYGSTEHPDTFSYPSMTINAQVGRAVRVTWINQLIDRDGRYLPHLLPVDPTIHWANPGGGPGGRDSVPTFTSTPGPYAGPVPMIVHLHGASAAEECDGHPEAWYLPVAKDIPAGYASVGRAYDDFRAKFEDRTRTGWQPGRSTFEYDNLERATAEWFHDHTLGITRQNVYAGPAGFYLLRGGESDLPPGVLPGPAPGVGDPPGTRYYEVPIAIQDRSFNSDGGLFYPSTRQLFDGYAGPYVPDSDVPPIWNPDFLGNTIVVNGTTWPVFNVEQRRYRLRFLNACNSRGLVLKVATSPTIRPAAAALPLWQIGSDGGFLPSPLCLERLVTAPGQRADAIVDFSTVPVGTELYLINEGPEGAAHAGPPPVADPDTTGQVLKFVVGARIGSDDSVPPDQLVLPTFTPLPEATTTRRLSLNDGSGHRHNQASAAGGVTAGMLLGTLDPSGAAVPLGWSDPVTESPTAGSTEIWELHNRTGHTHPIHVHGVQFQVVGRGPDGRQPPNPWESGYLDTVVVLPREITRIKARFDRPGRFAWHCNILEHEDNGMMRPYQVVPRGAPETGGGGTDGVNRPLAAAGIAALSVAAIAGAALARERRAPVAGD